MPACHYCKKPTCTDCSNRESPLEKGGSSKVRICHVCKVNRSHRGVDDGPEMIIGKPKDFKKMINVQHDNKTG